MASDIALDVPVQDPRGDVLLEADGLDVGYGAVPVVRGLNLQVRAGEVVALLGPNGAGKTTTLLGLVGELRPSGGRLAWHGVDGYPPLNRLAKSDGLGFVTEERSVIFGLSTCDNLRLGRGNVDIALDLFPELRPLLRRKAGLLSGGEQQMLTLARALSREPSVLIADELSLGLAPVIVQRLLSAVRDAASRGVGVLLVEQHVGNALAVCDRALVMRRGEVVLTGDSAHLRTRVDELEASYFATAS